MRSHPQDSPPHTKSQVKSAGDSRLGSIAKFASPPPLQAQDATRQRFKLQSVARHLLPRERVAQCLRKIAPGTERVEIVVNASHDKAHFQNLITCNSVWTCPVCAARITEHRASELTRATAKWHYNGGFVALFTYTMRHNYLTPLEDTLSKLREAHRKFKSGAPFQRLSQRYGWVGSVTALEVTHGENGWHPHLHELVFFEPMSQSDFCEVVGLAKKRWLTSVAAAGGDATWEHGLDVRDGDESIQKYVAKFGKLPKHAKWTVEREIAKAASKKARHEGRTPFALLMDYGDGDVQAGMLFQEYARCFKGRKQLVWSRGLRDLLEMGEEIADEAITEIDETWEIVASIDRSGWNHFINLPGDLRADLLHIASTGNAKAIHDFLTGCGLRLM